MCEVTVQVNLKLPMAAPEEASLASHASARGHHPSVAECYE